MNIKVLLCLCITILPLFLASYFLFLKDPPVWPDEGTSLYMAQALLKNGHIDAFNYGGVPPEAKRAGLAFPPLYFFTLGVWSNFFGGSIESIRSLSLLLGSLAAATFFALLKYKYSLNLAILGTLLLTFNIHFAKASRFGRPEILAILIINLSLLCWYLGQKNTKYIYLSGVLASLAAAAHPIGILAVVIIILALFFSGLTLKRKALFLLWTLLMFSGVTLSWLLTTQRSLADFYKALSLGVADKAYHLNDLLAPFMAPDPAWFSLTVGQYLILLMLFLTSLKLTTLRKESLFIFSAAFISLGWIDLQKVLYYGAYPVPLIVLAIITLVARLKFALQILVAAFFITINIYLQFFNIGFYSPALNFTQLGNFNYHQFTDEIKSHLPESSVTLFLASIPDPYLDLKKNPNFTLYQAIDPNYPIDELDYQKTLDSSDFVIHTWIPHPFLAEYLANNTLRVVPIGQEGGYSATLVQLKPRGQRHHNKIQGER